MKHKREAAQNMGMSIDIRKPNYTNKKNAGFDVEVFYEPRQKWVQNNKK